MLDQDLAWLENVPHAVRMFGCTRLAIHAFQESVVIMTWVRMNTPEMAVSKIWVNPTRENIPLSKDTVAGGLKKVQNHAQDIILAHHVDEPKATSHRKPQLMNYPKMHSKTMMRHRKLHLFRRMIIKKVRNLKQFRRLNLQIEHQELEREEAVPMHLQRSSAQRT